MDLVFQIQTQTQALSPVNTLFLKFAGLIGEFNLKNDDLLSRNFGLNNNNYFSFDFGEQDELWRGCVCKSDL